MNPLPDSAEKRETLKIVGIYAGFSLLWIYLSDSTIGLFIQDPQLISRIAIFKGFLFVFVTAALLYKLIFRYVVSMAEANRTILAGNERLRLYFERQLVGMAITSPEKGWLQVNDRLCSMLGYTRDELDRLTWTDLTHPDDLAEDLSQFNRLLSGEIDEYSLEKRFIRKDGTIVITNLSVGCVRCEDGSVDYVLALLEDITEHRVAELALRESQQEATFLASLLERSSQPFAVGDANGRLIRSNAAFTNLTGYSKEELATVSWTVDLTPPKWREYEQNMMSELISTGRPVRYEKEYVTKSGSLVPVELFVDLVRDETTGQPRYYSAFVTDISVRKQSEEALRASETLLRAVFDNAPFEVWVRNRDGCCIMQNSTSERHWGNILGKKPEDSEISPEDLSIWQANNRRAFAGEVVRGEVEYAVNGRKRIFENVVAPIYLGGEVISIIGFNIDITEQRKTEEQLRQALKMESIGRLAGGIAHDFNNMLSVIIGQAQLSMLKVPSGDPLWNNLDQIIKAAERSSDITRQLLAFSRKEIVAPRPVNLNSLVMEMEKTLGRLIGEDIHLTYKHSVGLWTVMIDPSQVSQLLINLAANARDAMPDGGQLLIETSNAHIDEACPAFRHDVTPGDYVRLAVRDNGTGMDSETLEHIFEPFFTTKEVGKGTGLGLATVYGIVSQNNGFIEVSSQPGIGTTFNLYLPRLMEDFGSEPEVDREDLSGSGTILLVEDDEMVRWSTTQTLEGIGYTVIQSESPLAAIETVADSATHIDIIITDVVMPGMNGLEMMEKINAIRPGLKVLFMSGYTEELVAQRGVVEEWMNFIQKPFSIYSLNRKINELMGSSV